MSESLPSAVVTVDTADRTLTETLDAVELAYLHAVIAELPDDADLEALAARIGVTLAHLRALMRRHRMSAVDNSDPFALRGRWQAQSFSELRKSVCADFELAYLKVLVAARPGTMTEAARLAGVDRKHLARLLERHGMSL